jgi:hypothetical protein
MNRHPDFRAELPNTAADFEVGQKVRLRRNPTCLPGRVISKTADRIQVTLSTGYFWYYPGDLLLDGQEPPELDSKAECALWAARKAWETMGWSYRTDYETYRLTGNPRRSTS